MAPVSQPDEPLGEPGRRALMNERAARHAAQAALREVERQLADARTEVKYLRVRLGLLREVGDRPAASNGTRQAAR